MTFGAGPKQGVYLAALAGGASHLEAARVAGVSLRTARRWWASPMVRAQVREAQSEMMARAARVAASEAIASLEALAAIRDDDAAPVGARVAACRAVLEHARGLHDDVVVAERLDEIERVVFGDEYKR